MPRADAGGQQEAADVNPLKLKSSIILIYTALFNTKPARDCGSLGQLVKRVRSYDPTLFQFLGSPLVQGSVKLLTLRPHRTEHSVGQATCEAHESSSTATLRSEQPARHVRRRMSCTHMPPFGRLLSHV